MTTPPGRPFDRGEVQRASVQAQLASHARGWTTTSASDYVHGTLQPPPTLTREAVDLLVSQGVAEWTSVWTVRTGGQVYSWSAKTQNYRRCPPWAGVVFGLLILSLVALPVVVGVVVWVAVDILEAFVPISAISLPPIVIVVGLLAWLLVCQLRKTETLTDEVRKLREQLDQQRRL
jgi:hypothetical protein